MKWIGQITYDEVAYFREDVIIEAGNKLGIGTTSPSQALDVFGNIKMQNNNALMSENVAGGTRSLIALGSDNVLRIKGNDSEGSSNVISMVNGGNVGIGTTSPGVSLDVAGNIKSSAGGAWATSSGGVQLNYASSTGYLTTYYDSNALVLGAGVSQKTGITINGQSHGDGNLISLKVGNAERMRVTSSGNVGIGTTSPASRLDVVGGYDATPVKFLRHATYGNIIQLGRNSVSETAHIGYPGDATLNFSTAGSERIRITSAGNVGIGATSPSSILHLKSDTSTLTLESSDTSLQPDQVWASLDFKENDSSQTPVGSVANISAVAKAGNTNFGNLLFQTKPRPADTYNDTLFLASSGNVGIGTTSPTQALHLPDSKQIALGTGADLKIQHNGTNSEIGNSTGQLNIYNHADNSDINFMADDNSGGLLTYFFLDGSAKTLEYRVPLNIGVEEAGHDVTFYSDTSGKKMLWQSSTNQLKLSDNVYLSLGDSGDLYARHTGGYGDISNNTGYFYIRNNANDSDIVFQADDGSGGLATYFQLDGSEAITTVSREMRFFDNVRLKLGSGPDLQIFHDGANSFINQSGTGHLYIQQNTNDHDVILQSDDGSGGTTDYIRLDGSETKTIVSQTMEFQDNVKLAIGNSEDMIIDHNATDTRIINYTGNLRIVNAADDKDITFESDDGSGGVETFFYLDGSHGGNPITMFPDNSSLNFGSTFGDLRILHDGSNSTIENGTGALTIRQKTNDGDLVLQCDDGSGGHTAYLTLDGGDGNIKFYKDISNQANANLVMGGGQIKLADAGRLYIGDSNDLQLYHNGSDSYIVNQKGNLSIVNDRAAADVILMSDDGSGGTTAYLTLDGSATNMKAYKDMRFIDNVDAEFGDGGDFKIYHDGSNTYLEQINSGTGNIVIANANDDSDIIFKSDNGSGGVATYFSLDGSLADGTYNYTKWPDYSIACFGSSNDLCIWHDSNNSYIRQVGTGDLIIENITDDKDIILKSDNGSGGTTAYLTLDGGSSRIEVAKNMRLADNVSLLIGGSSDLYLKHDGSNSYISQGGTGNLYIQQNTADKDLILQCDDGSGGTTAYLTLDGSASQVLSSVTLKSTPPNANTHSLILGRADTGNVWNVNHAGSDFRLYNTAGSGSDILFGVDSGSGAIANKVGIGVATPASTLHVAGTVQVGVDDTGHDVKFFGATSGEYMLWDESEDALRFTDNTQLRLGIGNDLRLWHNGTNSYVFNYTGNLYVGAGEADKDTVFLGDDGSGGDVAYLTLDGGLGYTTVQKRMKFDDNTQLQFGNDGDLQFYHTGGVGVLYNNTGDFTIRQNADDKDIIFQCDDGSGGVAEYFRLDGGLSTPYTVFPDNSTLTIGSGFDLKMYHNGSNSYIDQTGTGHLYIRNTTDDADIIFQSDDGSGGVETYFFLDGSRGGANPATMFPDNSRLFFGNGEDLVLYHDGSNNFIQNQVGDLTIKNLANDKDIIFQSDDGSGGVETYFKLDGSASSGNPVTIFPDNSFLTIGNGQDLAISHNGSHSYITQNGTGNLYIQQNQNDKDIIFQSDDGSGGVTAYLTLDGGAGTIEVAKTTRLADSVSLKLGSATDLELFHDGTNSFINNNTGPMFIRQNVDDGDIRFQSDDGSGGVTDYLKLDGSEGRISTKVNNRFDDSVRLELGTSGDLDLYHDGSHSYVNNATGNLVIRNQANDGDISFQADNGSGGDTTYLTLDGSAETVVVNKPLLINGAAIKASPNLYDNIIKLLPSDFVTNDHAGVGKFGIGYVDTAGSSYGMKPTNADTELYTFVSIPQGMKATHVDVYDKYNKGVIVYEAQINATTLTSKGTGNCNTQIDITDVNATATNFLAIQVTTTATSDRVFGGQVTIAAI